MGEAKQRRSRVSFFIERHPLCCFCGGTKKSTTIDHVPSRAMFWNRRRPEGMEFPACQDCNSGTAQHEQVVAMIVKSYPDIDTDSKMKELRNQIHKANKFFPGLSDELTPTRKQARNFEKIRTQLPGDIGGALNANGTIVNLCLKEFGIKLILALHYECTQKIIPASGGVAFKWYTNWDRFSGNFPWKIPELMGSPLTLRQGSWHVADEFSYRFALLETRDGGAYSAFFRQSFTIIGFAVMNAASFPEIPGLTIYKPWDRST